MKKSEIKNCKKAIKFAEKYVIGYPITTIWERKLLMEERIFQNVKDHQRAIKINELAQSYVRWYYPS